MLSYPFVAAEVNAACGGVGIAQQVRVFNALDPQQGVMRTSLLPGLIGVAQRNLSRGLVDLAVFEAGSVFIPNGILGTADIAPGATRPTDDTLEAMNASLPQQPWWVAGMLTGNQVPRGVGQRARATEAADAIEAARLVVECAGGTLQVQQGEHQVFHPGRCATLLVHGEPIGVAGELLPSFAEAHDLPRRVAAFELDGSRLLELVERTPHTLAPLSAMPAATQDISIVAASDIPAAAISDALAEGAGPLLEHIVLTDEYRGDGVDEGSRSLTFALRFRAADRTLTQAEATEAKQAGLALAASRYGVSLRGE